MVVFSVGLLVNFSCEKEPDTEGKKAQTSQKESAVKNEPASRPTLNVKENDKIASPLLVKVNSEGIWHAMEGELGWIQLVDESGNEFAKGILFADGEWMVSGSVMFSTTLTFDSKNAKTGRLIISHDQPGDGEGDEEGEVISFEVPVTF